MLKLAFKAARKTTIIMPNGQLDQQNAQIEEGWVPGIA